MGIGADERASEAEVREAFVESRRRLSSEVTRCWMWRSVVEARVVLD